MLEDFSTLSVSALSGMFRMSVATIRRKLASVSPSGYRRGSPVYDVYDAAPFLVKPQFDIEKYIRELKPTDLPASLQKDFWNAQIARQKFEEEAGKLWRSERVTKVLVETFKLLREQIVLFGDNASRQTGLTPEQRKLIDSMTDSLLDALHNAVVTHFAGYDTAGERDDLLENGMPTTLALPDDSGDDELDNEEEEIDVFD